LEIQEYTEIREMEKEIILEDSLGALHKVKYLDENRVIVQRCMRYVSEFGEEDITTYAMPAKVRLHQIDTWPFSDDLKEQILSFHAQFTDAK
tara:strand:- start:186 stop:461 length:276 start_codon:yes stop_codon:yes gene_type:complete